MYLHGVRDLKLNTKEVTGKKATKFNIINATLMVWTKSSDDQKVRKSNVFILNGGAMT